MSMTGHEKQLLVSVMLAASVTFVAGGVLIGTYGSAGAAVALCLGLITYNIMLVIKCYKCMGIKTYLNTEAFHVAVNVMR